jgi:hypothetical protein
VYDDINSDAPELYSIVLSEARGAQSDCERSSLKVMELNVGAAVAAGVVGTLKEETLVPKSFQT